ncbi:hypothetical protein VTH06DRAFT_8574 [Thermothelomyces fergusii]
MKTFVPFAALAAGVSATFIHAPPFTCPANTNNQCSDKQKPGFSWDDLDFGDFFDYGGFHFRGWKCEDAGGWRGRFAPRTFKKIIGGTCHSDKSKSPSFGGGPNVDKFSLGSIHVKPEFDCDLEFHYDMPDGSVCKHRSPCSKSGTTVYNTQCGGAKSVTIVYPPQPDKPKPSCSIQVPTISFDCNTASSTLPPTTTTSQCSCKTAPPAGATTTASCVKPSSTSDAEPSSTPEISASTTSAGETGAPPVQTSTELVPESSTTSVSPAEETSSTSDSLGEEASTTTSVSPEETVSTSVSPSEETGTTTVVSPGEETSSTASVSPEETGSTSVSPEEETGTTTSVSPGEETSSSSSIIVTPPSGESSSTATETSTTLVTEPTTASDVAPTGSAPSDVPSDSAPDTTPSDATPAVPGASATSTLVSGGSSDVVSSVLPVETLPCPAVLPSCLNTFLFTVGCSDNTDTACYCPDATFVKSVYDCLYAHGDSDAVIAEAIAYFQGICAGWAGENPAIATGATVTTYITVTATPTVAPVYTTVTVDITTVVPITDDAGQVIPSSSTTVTINTSLTVPQVGFASGSSDVQVIPITTAPAAPPAPVATATATAASPAGDDDYDYDSGSGSDSNSGSGPGSDSSLVVPGPVFTNGTATGITTPSLTGSPNPTDTPVGPGPVFITANGTATGIVTPSFTGSPRPTDTPVVVGGSGRVTASFGLAAVVAFLAFAL